MERDRQTDRLRERDIKTEREIHRLAITGPLSTLYIADRVREQL